MNPIGFWQLEHPVAMGAMVTFMRVGPPNRYLVRCEIQVDMGDLCKWFFAERPVLTDALADAYRQWHEATYRQSNEAVLSTAEEAEQ